MALLMAPLLPALAVAVFLLLFSSANVAAVAPTIVKLQRRAWSADLNLSMTAGFAAEAARERDVPSAWRRLVHPRPLTSLSTRTFDADALRYEKMRNRQNLQYTATMLLGVPAQEVNLVFDTGSSDLWASKKAFVPALSLTWEEELMPEVTMTYGKGKAAGEMGQDSACLASGPNPLCVKRQPMVVANQIEDMDMRQMDGILGLGFIGISHSSLTFLRNLNRSFQDLSFAFALKADSKNSWMAIGEHEDVMQHAYRETGLSADRVARAKVQDIISRGGESGLQPWWWLIKVGVKADAVHPLCAKWQVLSHSILFLLVMGLCTISSGQSLLRTAGKFESAPTGCGKCLTCLAIPLWFLCFLIGLVCVLGRVYVIATAGNFDSQVNAALDTGTSLLTIPSEDFESLAVSMFDHHIYNGKCASQSGALLCLCSVVADVRPLTIVVGDLPITLTGQDMFMEVGTANGQAVCMTGLASSPHIPIWILGDVFLRQVYAVHNFAQREVALFPYQKTEVDERLEAALPTSAMQPSLFLFACALGLVFLASVGCQAYRTLRGEGSQESYRPLLAA